METRGRFPIGRMLFEVVLILLGVFLGLFVNEKRIEQREKARAEESLTLIRAEMEFNKGQIDAIAPHHAVVRDSLHALLTRMDGSEKPVSLGVLWTAIPGGFGVPELQRHAWDLATRLGTLEHLDYRTLLRLSLTYELQEFYTRKYDRLADNLYLASNADPSSRNGLVLALSLLAGDVVIHEEDLAEAYGKAIEHLDEMR